ncbi:helix-turn-helix transcriptional regulator [Streptomyces sp. NPDC007971]|uniref:helix-turn-helix domain-containing protein n=1 Tax=Streptomyces sp. NPDC007971 TaxID=3364799 RepID=UPI0036F01A17
MTAPAPTTPLTPAERRIARHVVNGLPARQIADAETLSHHTVRAHLLSLRKKLHCPERCSLAVVTTAFCNNSRSTFTGQTRSVLHPFEPGLGNLHAPVGAVQQQVQPGKGVLDAGRTTSVILAELRHWSLQATAGRPLTPPAESAVERASPGPLETRACRPPEADARRRRFADLRVTLNRRAA